jgi:hypothetical protein
MDDKLESLLRTELLQPPGDFADRIMQRIEFMPAPPRRNGLTEKLQELALLAGGILGAAQLASFMFGIWTAAVAG